MLGMSRKNYGFPRLFLLSSVNAQKKVKKLFVLSFYQTTSNPKTLPPDITDEAAEDVRFRA